MTRQKWGQHFLTDRKCLEQIPRMFVPGHADAVLEIGPGKGALTAELVKRFGKVLAVEIDPKLCRHLEQKFGDSLVVINKNFLHISADEITRILGEQWVIAANLPFYITAPILKTLFALPGWTQGVITVQKEVARRMVAVPGTKDYGLLSLLTEIHTETAFMRVIPREAFSPPPRVDAGIVRMTKRERALVDGAGQESFFSLLKMCFEGRRKMVVNSLTRGLKKHKKEVYSLLGKAGIDPCRRPETISLDEFKRLFQLTAEK